MMAAIVAHTILQDRIVGSRADSIELKVGIAPIECRCDPFVVKWVNERRRMICDFLNVTLPCLNCNRWKDIEY